MEKSIIDVKNLFKSYGDKKAVKGISFSVKKGELFSFLGSNGAGKSTTIEILCTLLTKDKGNITISGYDLDKNSSEIRKKIGVVFQSGVLDDNLTVKENLKIRGSLYGLSSEDIENKVNELSEVLDFRNYINQKYRTLSGGQKRKADIARALINVPEILFLDEPTTGLDPKTRKYIWDAIDELRINTGMTVFLTTHYMEEVAKSNYSVIMHRGEIITEGIPNDLKDRFAQDSLIIYNPNDFVKKYFENSTITCFKKTNQLSITIKNYVQAYEILKALEGNIESCEIVKGSMDDVFLNIIDRYNLDVSEKNYKEIS